MAFLFGILLCFVIVFSVEGILYFFKIGEVLYTLVETIQYCNKDNIGVKRLISNKYNAKLT